MFLRASVLQNSYLSFQDKAGYLDTIDGGNSSLSALGGQFLKVFLSFSEESIFSVHGVKIWTSASEDNGEAASQQYLASQSFRTARGQNHKYKRSATVQHFN